ncbi:uncharacterized protein EV154DRAFT_130821 [Mucor mucedo]|uniref:uncharacterized protein n=1 Tax=Mucor mucedo TaxID=29922 RepID=UPI00221F13F2|nr:uncharacterized protein EV154DRAFT_130821 [Mucor mucedo]KAI7893707.1 hypothetical protein EV154DRAFT_130821 [Mucor mucedo]
MATVEWTVLEKLLLSQAVYKYGEDNWFQIARNLKHHALLDRPSDYFNQKNCSLQYYLMVEEMDKHKRQSYSQDMPMVVRIARELYSLRLEELKRAISEDEEKFLILVSEIDDIRAGKWDNQLLGLPEPPKDPEPTQQTEDQISPVEDITKNELLAEEQQKVEADNLENEARNVRNRDVTPDMSGMPAVDTPPRNIPTSPIELERSELDQTTPGSNVNLETQEQSYDTYMDQQTHPLKNRIDDSDVTDLPALKRQKIDDTPSAVFEDKDSHYFDHIGHDAVRTDYSTDVSQGTTPADTYDAVLREGTESVAGSESNAATPTNERRKGGNNMVGKDDQRHKSWQKNINLLWREIANHKNGAMFMNPIKETIAPHYYDIVKRPMDLKTIKNRIRDGVSNNILI